MQIKALFSFLRGQRCRGGGGGGRGEMLVFHGQNPPHTAASARVESALFM